MRIADASFLGGNMYKFVKQGLIILSSIAIVICLLVGCAIYYFKMSDVNYIVDFLNENPERTSFLLLENGEKVISFSPDNQMPLASVYKMLIALEFIRQVDEGMINPKD